MVIIFINSKQIIMNLEMSLHQSTSWVSIRKQGRIDNMFYLIIMRDILQVMVTFCFFLLWYVFFIVAFGLGFYILLHKKPDGAADAGNKVARNNDETYDAKTVCAKEDEYEFFNYPWLSLIKTSTMFVGELVRPAVYILRSSLPYCKIR